ncbi:MAG: ChbG/HpnK family deacetylase [Spirochaetota bacterium]
MSGIRLVTRADDAGMGDLANHAIRETVTHGIVRNISLMAPAPAIRNAYDTLADLRDRVDFGLHVTLTAEWETIRWRPLTENKEFTRRDGTMFLTVEDLSAASPDMDDLMKEVTAQHDLLLNLGFELAYLDEHMLVGAIPGLADRLSAFAREKGLRYDREIQASGAVNLLPGWDGPGEHPGTELADQLSQAPPGTYLLVGHPATKDEEMTLFRKPGQSRGEEALVRNRQRRMFMDMEIMDYCENVGIELLRYSQL